MKATRLVNLDSGGVIYSAQCTVDHARGMIREAQEALDSTDIEPTGAVDTKHIDAIATVARAIHEIERHMPKIACWCVVKHYASHDADPLDPWNPVVWCGFTTEKQARAFAPAIAAHYEVEAKWRKWRIDRFEPEIGVCDIGQIIHPDLTPEEYIATLRT